MDERSFFSKHLRFLSFFKNHAKKINLKFLFVAVSIVMMNVGFFQNCAPTNFSAVNSGTEQMSSTALDQPLDGLCGSSNNLQLMSQPTTNLCSVGNADAIITSAGG